MYSSILIYAAETTNRLYYVCELVFGHHLGVHWRIVNDWNEFEASQLPRLNYSGQQSEDLRIEPAALLFETDIRLQQMATAQHNGITVPFATAGGHFPFDPLAAIFYLVSRYEEYLPFAPNQYGQFKAADSLAFQLGFLEQPVVDHWITDIKSALMQRYPAMRFADRTTGVCFTYDIDVAYAYKGRSSAVRWANMAYDLVTFNFSKLRERWQVAWGIAKDPYDTYDYIFEQQAKHQYDSRFFFLLGERNAYNHNLRADRPIMQHLIKAIAGKAPIGIHPSYYAGQNQQMMQTEIARLQSSSGQNIQHCRQHYLRIAFPVTYMNQLHNGITDDYSLGFAEHPGFRAGTSNPFYFFNLLQNQATGLLLHPVTCMEGTFIEDLQLDAAQTKSYMLRMADTVKKVNGQFLIIWHNHSLSEKDEWKGMRQVHAELAAFFKN